MKLCTCPFFGGLKFAVPRGDSFAIRANPCLAAVQWNSDDFKRIAKESSSHPANIPRNISSKMDGCDDGDK